MIPRIWPVGFVCASVLLAACGNGSDKAAEEAVQQLRGELHVSQSLLKDLHTAPGETGTLTTERSQFRTTLSKLHGVSDLSAGETRVVTKADRSLAALRDVAAARQYGAAAESRIASSSGPIVQDALLSQDLKPAFLADLNQATTDVLKDATCDATWRILTASEQDAARRAVTGVPKQADWNYTNVVDTLASAAPTVIANAVIGRLEPRWNDSSVKALVDWGQYGSSMLEKANEIGADTNGDGVPDASTVIVAPNWQETRAYYYYGSLCLRPPGF